ncbi:hypothetical protein SEA_OHMYWARD_39 [Gordonia phage OhMyWard]|uniref:Uncharacterized protein n=1 Tax=Gordonia phage OhMyWard TaxID=2652414 RepID=A0A5P8D8B3_9CAUD|nr:hypothetical protein HWC72_gp39 [Gordonia phage OhMyWard]QFP94921.1 hypothetical protein SEA_OHMYWARD_39 [Gordonia phage OhMyWard]WNM72420.1 hypothetical protein SEA_MOSSY_41 [Gordonia phage Mossy]
MTNPTYEAWRSELSKIQTRIDELDEAFWSKYCDSDEEYTEQEFQAAEAAHLIERQKIVEELENHTRQQTAINA